jgi:TRAP-type mannitol/chloroaromatic compound transport system substrate-binding protein
LKRANDKIAEASGGRLIIETHPGDSIVPADTEIDGVNKGILDVGHGAFSSWSATFPTAPMFTKMVAGPTALEYYFWYLWGPGMDLVQEMLDAKDYNVMPLAVDGEVPEVFLYTSDPVNTVEDLKGKKYRLLGDEASIFAKLDVSAIATPSGEIYEAMQRGVIDGFQHASLAADWDIAFYEIVNYAYMSGVRQPTDVFVYFVNKDSWVELPDDLKALVQEIYWQEGIRHYAEWTFKNTVAAPQWIDYGVIVEPINPSIEDALVAAAGEYYAERAAEDPFFAKVLKSLEDWRDSYKSTYPRL